MPFPLTATEPRMLISRSALLHNVAVLRTLSKAWGLAGLRVGYLVASPEVAAAVRKVVTPFSTSMAAQAAG